ncbi:hypothetical protein GARCT_00859 [Geobacillus sp. 12AMOR1]|nr:hypothetical protein GARCT_00859 [Geobacillus sp. 12AMOR1]
MIYRLGVIILEFKKKLIEVALPLDAINKASSREKSIRHGHPSTIHLWWSRKPLASSRAVIFASLVDDPSSHPDKFPTEKEQMAERERLFNIIDRLIQWENSNNISILEEAKNEIQKSTNGSLPSFLDPFCGGGSLPLEAQRLGLESYGTDLNPVAVMLTKSLIEFPYKVKNRPPVNPKSRIQLDSKSWTNASGLAEDIRYYGEWMKQEAYKRIGNLYPDLMLPSKYGGGKAKVIAWLYCRSVKCKNPACGIDMPLISKFDLCVKKGKEMHVEPLVEPDTNRVRFIVKEGPSPEKKGTVNRRGARCINCNTAVSLDYIREEGRKKRIGIIPIAIVIEGVRGRVYIDPHPSQFPEIQQSDFLEDIPATQISGYFNPPIYGFNTIGSMFIPRQKIALETFAGLVQEAKMKCIEDGADEEYAKIVATYLTLGVGRLANRLSAFAIWNTTGEKIEQTFSEQGVAMAWDFAEANPFGNSTGSWISTLEWIPKCLEQLPANFGASYQRDAASKDERFNNVLISTDPPYYNSITYSDFADFFYGIFRYSLRNDFPDIFSTLMTPKSEEAVAAWHRFDGDRTLASHHFKNKLHDAIKVLVSQANDEYPITFYYAFKEKDIEKENEEMFTAWESILSVLIECGLRIVHTWPLRTERPTGRKARKNSLASSILLVCRKRKEKELITRREFIKELKSQLPKAIENLKKTNIAPVDLAQAAIGPGMAIFSKYEKVLEADGKSMTIRSALQVINQELDSFLSSSEVNMDAESRFCVSWYEQYGTKEGNSGEADVLARAKNTTISKLLENKVLIAEKGKVRLLKHDEYDANWDLDSVRIPSVWYCTSILVRALKTGGEIEAARQASKLRSDLAEAVKGLAYRLFTIADKNGWTDEANDYNNLVIAWSEIQKKMVEFLNDSSEQLKLFE